MCDPRLKIFSTFDEKAIQSIEHSQHGAIKFYKAFPAHHIDVVIHVFDNHCELIPFALRSASNCYWYQLCDAVDELGARANPKRITINFTNGELAVAEFIHLISVKGWLVQLVPVCLFYIECPFSL